MKPDAKYAVKQPSSPVVQAEKPDTVAADAPTIRRGGRLSKAESDAKRTTMLATIREHPTLKDDRSELARIVGVSETTIWRWLNDEEETYRASKSANA